MQEGRKIWKVKRKGEKLNLIKETLKKKREGKKHIFNGSHSIIKNKEQSVWEKVRAHACGRDQTTPLVVKQKSATEVSFIVVIHTQRFFCKHIHQ